MGSSRSRRGEVLFTIEVLLDGMGEERSCVDGGGSANVTEEGLSCLRVERNLTKILRCWIERSW